MTNETPHIAVVGGGITGLSAAFYLQKELREKGLKWQVTLLESSDRLGGKIKTVNHNGFIMEQGPDSILERKTSAKELIRELGLEGDLVNNETGQAYILHNDRLLPIPEGAVMGVPTKLTPFASTPLVSPLGKVRALADLFLPRSKDLQTSDQSVGSFFRRRLGNEVVDRIIEPLLSGIYNGDIDKMSLMTVLPQFAEMEKKHRSLILAMANTRSPGKKNGKAKGAFITLKNGLYSMVEAIEEQLTDVTVIKGDPLKRIERNGEGYRLYLTNREPFEANAVIMATPHQVTSEALGNDDFLEPLRNQPVSVATILMVYPEDAVHLDKEGTGFIVPRTEPYTITACTWINRKWPHTTPPGKVLLRCYVGRDGEEEIVDKSDDELVEIAISDLKRIFPLTGEPEFTYVTHWKHAMPQFVIEHQDWLKRLNQNMALHYPGIFLIGSSYRGSGIPDCVEQGKNEAKNVIKYLS